MFAGMDASVGDVSIDEGGYFWIGVSKHFHSKQPLPTVVLGTLEKTALMAIALETFLIGP
jgi:hypothetical protein